MIYPTPWTGIGTALFVYLARVGTLARQRSLIKNLCVLGKSEGVQDQLKTDLVESARDTEATLLSFQIPEKNRVEDAGDPSTPVTHLQQLAQVYRLSALLELYRNFPDLLNAQHGATSDESPTARKILALTTSILTIIATIPQISGVNCLVTLPLIIAGSSLQSTVEPSLRQIKSGETSWDILSDDIVSLSSQEDAQLYWRGFVRSRLQATRGYVGIATISMAIEIVEKVWTRCDVLALSLPVDFVQWIDIMKDEKLEAIFG
ncbi:hypothetical protein VN97_g4401 [Penicillium thymicola]|uniref:Uncharacterized protein n=1 Tax=Penicillium thymicola TaxID=293382 RepID=A0AAI9X9Y4_PENTH|nr:hypothetical protein VN97_g4401 [Penicillium thymicola]